MNKHTVDSIRERLFYVSSEAPWSDINGLKALNLYINRSLKEIRIISMLKLVSIGKTNSCNIHYVPIHHTSHTYKYNHCFNITDVME